MNATTLRPRDGTRARSRSRRRTRTLGLGAAGAVAGLMLAVVAHALWSAQDAFSGGLLTTGDLDMTTGQATWAQITPGVSAPQSGVLDGTPTDFSSMPGDVLQIVQPVSTTLRGDNLNAGFTVDLADAAEAEGVELSFHIEDGEGNHVAPESGQADFGAVLTIPELTVGDAGRTDDWRVVIRIDVLGDYRWVAGDVTASPLEWAVSSIVVRLDQVREGTGFADGGAG